MKKLWNCLVAAVAVLAMGTAQASNPGELTVHDNAKMFSADGIKKAKDAFASEKFDSPTRILVTTYNGLPEKKKEEYGKLKNKAEKDAFAAQWARDEAKAEGAKGIFVLISENPNHLRVLSSEQMRVNREFGDKKDERMSDILLDAFKSSVKQTGDEQKATRDGGLLKAVEYAREQLKGTSAVSHETASPTHSGSRTRVDKGGTGMSLLGWVCIIGVVLLGVWLVIGLLRAVTGMGGGGYGGGMGGGYGGYGGGGGGFMSSLLGGMFGSMAGMWMYNNFFGGGMSSMSAGDYGGGGGYGGDYGNSGTAAGDDGNFDNGGDGGGGGDWGGDGGGDAGGGDFGGGGGDFGGGDFGGGDFGGGGGDFGGGGGGDW